MKRRRHHQKTAFTTGGHAVATAPLPAGKARCDVCGNVTSVTKAGILRRHRINDVECPGSGAKP